MEGVDASDGTFIDDDASKPLVDAIDSEVEPEGCVSHESAVPSLALILFPVVVCFSLSLPSNLKRWDVDEIVRAEMQLSRLEERS
jgi:hypothetical protein